jgi:glycosyltransferase EpsD
VFDDNKEIYLKKILYVSTVAAGKWMSEPFMQMFKEEGCVVHCACRDEPEITCADKFIPVCFSRNPYSLDNIRAYKQIKKLIKNEKYDLIHCNSPVASMVTRLAARKIRKQGTKVIYTAHGFHFFKGASLINWLVYYPIEKLLLRLTDCLITINKEDYKRATGWKNGKDVVKYLPGVGVDLDRFYPVDGAEKQRLRDMHGYKIDDFILLYVAEFISRKNHRFLITSLPVLKEKIPTLKLLFAGKGKLYEPLKKLCKKRRLTDCVEFLGFSNDVPNLCRITDVLVSPSKQEGLPINIIEGMASGIPIVCSRIRGHVDLIKHCENGLLHTPGDKNSFIKMIMNLYNNYALHLQSGLQTSNDIKKYSIESIKRQMMEIVDGIHI